MSGSTHEIVAARAAAAVARARLMGSWEDVKDRLAPKSLAIDAWEGARDRGVVLANDAVAAARERPAAGSAVLAGLSLFFLRKPLWRSLRSIFFQRRETVPAQTGLEADSGSGTTA